MNSLLLKKEWVQVLHISLKWENTPRISFDHICKMVQKYDLPALAKDYPCVFSVDLENAKQYISMTNRFFGKLAVSYLGASRWQFISACKYSWNIWILATLFASNVPISLWYWATIMFRSIMSIEYFKFFKPENLKTSFCVKLLIKYQSWGSKCEFFK